MHWTVLMGLQGIRHSIPVPKEEGQYLRRLVVVEISKPSVPDRVCACVCMYVCVSCRLRRFQEDILPYSIDFD